MKVLPLIATVFDESGEEYSQVKTVDDPTIYGDGDVEISAEIGHNARAYFRFPLATLVDLALTMPRTKG